MLTGWKEIIKYTGFSRNTLKRLMREQAFPIYYVATKPVAAQSDIEQWVIRRKEAICTRGT